MTFAVYIYIAGSSSDTYDHRRCPDVESFVFFQRLIDLEEDAALGQVELQLVACLLELGAAVFLKRNDLVVIKSDRRKALGSGIDCLAASEPHIVRDRFLITVRIFDCNSTFDAQYPHCSCVITSRKDDRQYGAYYHEPQNTEYHNLLDIRHTPESFHRITPVNTL